MKNNKSKYELKNSKKGYALLTAILAVAIFSVMMLKARTLWQTELRRDLEEEMIFRARQYVRAIEFFRVKNLSVFPQNLDVLFEKKFLRKRFKDPMTPEGKWNVVMMPANAQGKANLLIVPEDMVPEYITRANIVGVSSSSCEEGFKEYRKKKKYCEWAIYLGDQVDKEMPKLDFVALGEGQIEEEETPQPGDNRRPNDEDEEEKGEEEGRENGRGEEGENGE